MFKIKKFDFLISLYIFCICISELMGGKTFHILSIGSFILNGSVALFVLPLVYSVNDIIVEVEGVNRARSVVRSGLIMVFFIILFSLLATALPPSSRFVTKESAYDSVFQLSARIATASLIAFGFAEFLDVFIFSKLREKLGKNTLWIRTNLSNFISEFFDTAVFMVLAFYALDKSFGANASFLFSLILPYWLLKCFMSIIETPLVYGGVKWLKAKV